MNEFQPADEKFLELIELKIDDKDKKSAKFTQHYAPPYGLSQVAAKGLGENLQDHIEAIVEGPRNRGELKQGDMSIVSWEIWEAIDQYRRATKVSHPVEYPQNSK